MMLQTFQYMNLRNDRTWRGAWKRFKYNCSIAVERVTDWILPSFCILAIIVAVLIVTGAIDHILSTL